MIGLPALYYRDPSPEISPTVDALMNALLFVREEARKAKDWKTADHIRNTLGQLGFEIQDTDHGPVWRKK